MTFDDMWKSLEERDTTGKYKQAREMAELGMEQLEFAYNSGYADAKSKYARPQAEWKLHETGMIYYCSNCGHYCCGESGDNYCGNCGAYMKGGADNENR